MNSIRLYIVSVSLLVLGMFLMPTKSYACNMSSETTQKECSQANNKKVKDCCKASSSCKKNTKKHKKCEGNCKDNSCHCSSTISKISGSIIEEIKTNNFIAKLPKQKYAFKQAYISSNFHFIWQPPKIS